MKTKFTCVLMFCCILFANAQKKEIICAEKLAKANELIKILKFDDANLLWLDVKEKCPTLNETIYTSGETLLTYYIDSATTPEEKEKSVRNLMSLYDEYDANFPLNNQENQVKKGLLLQDNDLGTAEEKFQIFDKIFQNTPDKFTNPSALYIYFDLFYTKMKNNPNGLQIDEIIAKYGAMLGQLDLASKKSNQTDSSDYKRVKDGLEALLSGVITKERLLPYFQKNYENNSNNTYWLENAAEILFSKNASSDPLFLSIVTSLHKLKPTSKSAYYMGFALLSTTNRTASLKYFEQAALLATDPNEKATIYYLAATTSMNYNKSETKRYILKAAEAAPTFGKGYFLLAQLYANSAKECGKTPFEVKAIQYLASETVLKAGQADATLKESAQQQSALYLKKAPKAAEIKLAKLAGKKITFFCWINESIVVPKN
jgi:hypothetical protein